MKAKKHYLKYFLLAFAIALCTAFISNMPASVHAAGGNDEKKVCTVNFWLDYYGTETYAIEVLSGETFTLPEYPFKTKEPGMKFIGWEDPCDYTYSTLQPGTNFWVTGNYYFYAKFEKEDNTYMKVRFAPNYDDRASGAMNSALVPKGSLYTLPTPEFTPAEGWEFDCWYPDLKPGDKYQLPENQDEYTFWAVYKEAADTLCEIIYEDDFGNNYTETVKKNTKHTLIGQAFSTPVKDTSFDGWIITEYTNPSGSTIEVGSTVYEPGTVINVGTNSIIKIKAKYRNKGRIDECTIDIERGEWSERDYTNSSSYYREKYDIYENYCYCGQPIIPIYTVRDANGRLLTEGVDYIAEYSNNINAGYQALITITGINGYANTGTKTANFVIHKLVLTYEYEVTAFDTAIANNVNFSYEIVGDKDYYYYYTGKEIKPKFKVTYKGRYDDKNIVLPMSDFILTPERTPIAVGNYGFELVGSGENVVTAKSLNTLKAFEIIPPKQHINKVESRYNDKKQLFGMGVTFDKLTKDLNRVEIKVMWGSAFKKSKTYTVSGKGKKLLDFDLTKKMLKAGKVKIMVRYAVKSDGKYYYGPWSSARTIKLKKTLN